MLADRIVGRRSACLQVAGLSVFPEKWDVQHKWKLVVRFVLEYVPGTGIVVQMRQHVGFVGA